MKIVNKIILILIIIGAFACSRVGGNHKNENSGNPEFENDSTFYHLDVMDDIQKETFLLIRQVVAGDSVFGAYSDEIVQKAIIYGEKINSKPYVKYDLQQFINGSYQLLWIVHEENFDDYYDTEIDQGRMRNNSDMKFLRILRKQSGTLNVMCINFICAKDGSWQVLSKERIITDSRTHETIGYCIDTINKQYNVSYDLERPKNEINFKRAFSEPKDSHWDCN